MTGLGWVWWDYIDPAVYIAPECVEQGLEALGEFLFALGSAWEFGEVLDG